MKRKPDDIDTEDMPEDSLRVGPLGVIASVLIALMSSAILYNLIWRQQAFDPDAEGGRRTYVEIVAGEDKGSKRERSPLHKKNSERSALVRGVQGELSSLGLFDGPVDGIAGEKTRAAIAAYQQKHRLEPSGKADRKLLDHLRFTRLLEAGEHTGAIAALAADQKVARVQKGLAALGYRPGAFDGFLGAATREAIRQFERDRNWPVTGELSDLLIAELSDIGAFAEADEP